MNLLEVFAISGFINGFITLGLGVFIISHNWRDKLNRLYFLIVLATGLWSFSYWRWLSSGNAVDAIFWVRMLSIGSILIPVFYFHWITSLLKIDNLQKITIRLVYILGALLVLVSFSDLFVASVTQKLFFPFWPNPGILYHFYLFILYLSVVIYSGKLIYTAYKKSLGEDRKRLTYIFMGAVIAFAGGLSNFFLWYNIPIPPYGNFLIAFYPVLFGYATIKYRLFHIKTMATELFTIAIWIFLLIKILLSSNYSDLLVNIVLFLIIVFLGVLLMRSASKELKQKEQIEEYAMKAEQAYEIEKRSKEELENLDKTKNDFIMAIQHHLRTPLAAIMGYNDLLLTGAYGKLPKKTIDVIGNIQISTKNLIKMVNDFLDVTQFQLGKNMITLRPGVDVLPIIEEIIKELKFEADKKGISLEFKKPESVPLIKADREKLKAAIYNIIDNAVKYTTKGGVAVNIERGNALKIAVRDNGIGVAKEHLENMFGKTFERGEAARKTFINGRGIGLYITNQIIKSHNGKIWVESDGLGKGATFYIELPITN